MQGIEVITWGATPLCDSRANTCDVLTEFAVNGRRVVQDVELLRAVSTTPLNRQNTKVQMSLSVTRKWKDIFSAKNFLVAHEKALTAETGTTVTMQFGTTGQYPTWTLNSALVESDGGTLNGVETIHHYTITGGYFS